MLNSRLAGASRAAHTRPGRAGARLTAETSNRVPVPVSPAGQSSGVISPAQLYSAHPERSWQPPPAHPTDPAGTPPGEGPSLHGSRAGRDSGAKHGSPARHGSGTAPPLRSRAAPPGGTLAAAPPGRPAAPALPPRCRHPPAASPGGARPEREARRCGKWEGREGGREGCSHHPPAFPFQAGRRRWGREAQPRPTGRAPGRAEPSPGLWHEGGAREGRGGHREPHPLPQQLDGQRDSAAVCASGPASASDRSGDRCSDTPRARTPLRGGQSEHDSQDSKRERAVHRGIGM